MNVKTFSCNWLTNTQKETSQRLIRWCLVEDREDSICSLRLSTGGDLPAAWLQQSVSLVVWLRSLVENSIRAKWNYSSGYLRSPSGALWTQLSESLISFIASLLRIRPTSPTSSKMRTSTRDLEDMISMFRETWEEDFVRVVPHDSFKRNVFYAHLDRTTRQC